MSSLRIITQRLNPFSQKVATALDIKKLEFEYVYVDDPAEVRRYNPTSGTLPVLEDGKRRVANSTAILR